jgi:hypothetical protein
MGQNPEYEVYASLTRQNKKTLKDMLTFGNQCMAYQ